MVTNFAASWFIKYSHKIAYVADWPFDITAIDRRAVVPRLVHHSQTAENLSTVQKSCSHVRVKGSSKRFLKLTKLLEAVVDKTLWLEVGIGDFTSLQKSSCVVFSS